MNYKLFVILFLAGLIVLFSIQNVAVVDIQFLLWSASIPRALLVFIVLGTGIVIGWFSHSFIKYRKNEA